MRQLMIVNSLATTVPTAKGALAIRRPSGFITDLTANPNLVKGTDVVLDFLNSLGNGSIKHFSINPFNCTFKSESSGATAEVSPSYAITYPTGNAIVDSMTNQFQGGIIVKEWDADKNVWNPKLTIPVQVVGSGATVANADVVIAFKAALATITGAGKYIASASHTGSTSSLFTLTSDNTYIETVGDLRHFNMVKTKGMTYVITGSEVAKFERELASMTGYSMPSDDNDLYEDSNFIADKTAQYNMVTITTRTEPSQPLLPNSAGLLKTLHIAFKKDGGAVDTIFANFKTFMGVVSKSL